MELFQRPYNEVIVLYFVQDYLPAGKYVIGLFYMNTYEEVEYMRGAYNGLILEVTEDAINLSSPKPCFELDELFVVTMPQYSNEKLILSPGVKL